MSYRETVHEAARALNLLDHAGNLVPLDSLSALDFVAELERATNVSIPTSELRPDVFASIDTMATLLEKVTPAR